MPVEGVTQWLQVKFGRTKPNIYEGKNVDEDIMEGAFLAKKLLIILISYIIGGESKNVNFQI